MTTFSRCIQREANLVLYLSDCGDFEGLVRLQLMHESQSQSTVLKSESSHESLKSVLELNSNPNPGDGYHKPVRNIFNNLLLQLDKYMSFEFVFSNLIVEKLTLSKLVD